MVFVAGRSIACPLRLLLLASLLCGGGIAQARAETCADGVTTGLDIGIPAAYCRFFKTYSTKPYELDGRIRSALQVSNSDQTRSVALIVANSAYPAFPKEQQIPAAHRDAQRLADFFGKDQKFDEVIVLENADATWANMKFFLGTYLKDNFTRYGAKSRLIVAYSGHGIAKDGQHGALVLTSAARLSLDAAEDALYPLDQLRADILKLAPQHFHVLVLLSACYGGGLLGDGPTAGQDAWAYEQGSYGFTAGSHDRLTYSSNDGNGSLFFNLFQQGIISGDAAPRQSRAVIQDDVLIQQGGVVTLADINRYVVSHVEEADLSQGADGGPANARLPHPWKGPIEPADSRAGGAFFFLSPIEKLDPAAPTVEVSLRPASSVPGQPGLKVFQAPNTYPIRGIDISQAEGGVDWPRVRRSNVDFAYVRASYTAPDSRFRINATGAKTAGVDLGIFHQFDYCATVGSQFALLSRAVGAVVPDLPPAIALQPPNLLGRRQLTCSNALSKGLSGRVLDLAARMHTRFGKTPLIFGNRLVLQAILDARFDRYMIWFASYVGADKRNAGATLPDIRLPGTNPWTLWQYTAFDPVPGIGNTIDWNVFFGERDAYERFKEGRSNIALNPRDSP